MKKTQLLRDFLVSVYLLNQRFQIRRLYYLPVDLKDKLLGKTHKYVPSRGQIYTGSPASASEYIKTRYASFRASKNLCGFTTR